MIKRNLMLFCIVLLVFFSISVVALPVPVTASDGAKFQVEIDSRGGVAVLNVYDLAARALVCGAHARVSGKYCVCQAGFVDSDANVENGCELVDNDRDGFDNGNDNCQNVANPMQTDSDLNGVGDACEEMQRQELDLDADLCVDHRDVREQIRRGVTLGELNAFTYRVVRGWNRSCGQ